MQLEDIRPGILLEGVDPSQSVKVISTSWSGPDALKVIYQTPDGGYSDQIIYRNRSDSISIVERRGRIRFDAPADKFKLTAEAQRIMLAHLFDPYLAVTTSLIEPLPHQITAVYDRMLSCRPLRFLLADDPGSGKTIMAGLLIRELMVRGDVKRCMIVCPGSLVEQWQDELWTKFHTHFEILTNDKLEAAPSGNWFRETDRVIARLDKLSRDEDSQAKLRHTDWDLIICDEAHKMSAHWFGKKINYTKRYQLGELLSGITRQFLLMTATPHSGSDENFNLFMALIDPDRFEGHRETTLKPEQLSDIMRRLSKEELLRFDGTKLFPPRYAYTVNFELSDLEQQLYDKVTEYVREEFNRADKIEDGKRRGTVGFALTILQRRLASSPEAIYQSLRRRKERLENRLEEMKLIASGEVPDEGTPEVLRYLSEEDFEDLEEAPEEEVEDLEEHVVDQATAARSIPELEAEIRTLEKLKKLAAEVVASHCDRKWDELRNLLQQDEYMYDEQHRRRKLVIFTEHKDTLNYLRHRISTLIGGDDKVVEIHGGVKRDARRAAQENFCNDPNVSVLVATDAAGEGINLQRAHLMVNYDLPWNPNRIEQRFGRIHRIGQKHDCYLWNLVASGTREGHVFERLFAKLEVERKTLGGSVFDVLGQVFQGRKLKDLLIDAIRHGDDPDTLQRIEHEVETELDTQHLEELMRRNALTPDCMNPDIVFKIKEQRERAEARKLQPFYISSYFREAFQNFGGRISAREAGLWEIPRVPGVIRSQADALGYRHPLAKRYERITFRKELVNKPGLPQTEFVCPGTPLLDAVSRLILQKNAGILKMGTILIDPLSRTEEPRVMFMMEHSIRPAVKPGEASARPVSQRMQFVEMREDGSMKAAGYAPYLDYRVPEMKEEAELAALAEQCEWLSEDLYEKAEEYAVEHIVPEHLSEVKTIHESQMDRAAAAIKQRLTREIAHWDRRAQELKEQLERGKQTRMNWQKARERAEDLKERMDARLEDLNIRKHLQVGSPVIIGAALVVPESMMRKAPDKPKIPSHPEDTRTSELMAMKLVMDHEREQGYEPRDVSAECIGYDIESVNHATGDIRCIEVKARIRGAKTVTLTKNEILTALNKRDKFILAIVLHGEDRAPELHYVKDPFDKEPDFGETSRQYRLGALIKTIRIM